VGGGRYVHCTKQGPGLALCRVETRRWLGRSVVEAREVDRVTRAGVRRTTYEESYQDSKNRTRTRTREAWSLELSREDSTETVPGHGPDVQAAAESLGRMLEGKGAGSVDLSLSEWKFAIAAMAFGAVWSLITGLIALHSWNA
jgi:hypothetical protein